MRLTFYGAARTVTGSQHLIEVNGTRILLDCGLYQGRRAEAFERNKRLPFDARTVDVVVLSHAHIDHSGNLPNLILSGYDGEIVCTHATRDLCASMLLDSGHIQERDIEFVNKQRRKQGDPPVDPIYTRDDAAETMAYFTTLGYRRPHQLAPGVTLTFGDAGHMLGSAFVILDIEDCEARRDMRLVFSGDLGRKGIPIIRDPEALDAADFLILESTYGDRLHPPYEDDTRRMEQIIVETYQRGGSVIIPAFAVGRTQQLVLMLHELLRKGDIPSLPIFVDSPLATDVTAAYRTHPECYDAEIRAFIEEYDIKGQDPFGFRDLRYTRTTEESKQINFLREPAIIIAPSGMAEHGRVLHHLKHRIEDPRNTVLIVGWQAEHTLGRRLVDGDREVRIFGEVFQNRARCEVLNGFSGHADRDELLAWVGGMSRKPAQTFLVHGEPPAQTAFAGSLDEQFGMKVHIPDWKQSFEV
ncbi:MAG: MBL fold metallo-hydrolase [Anaerolineae bacterium]|nr:MBL fold metallo-hydrolase [Anaerolineae bacterium]NUQ07227.1 MBL fold metallo-hydrolase [Anaerolineae bacterium]